MTIITSKTDGVDVITAADMNTIIGKIQNGTDFDLSIGRVIYPSGFTSTRIQNAVNALRGNIGKVKLSTGTYSISTAVVLPSGVCLEGDGVSTILYRITGTESRITSATGNVSGIHLRNFLVDGNQIGQTTNVEELYFGQNVRDVSIHDVTVINSRYRAISIDVTPLAIQSQRFAIRGCNFRNARLDGIFTAGKDVAIQNCNFMQIPDTAIDIGGYITPFSSQNVTCVGNTFSNVATAFAIAYKSKNIAIIGNTVSTATSQAIIVFPPNGTGASSVSIVGNIITSATRGIDVRNARHSIVANNIVSLATDDGISASSCTDCVISGNIVNSGSIDGIVVYQSNRVMVENNQSINNGTGGGFKAGVIFSSSTGCYAIGNITTDTGAGTQARGFEITNNSYAIVIKDNVIKGNTTNGIIISDTTSSGISIYDNMFIGTGIAIQNNSISKSFVAKRNKGYVTENGGDTSVSNGTAITHGLASTPNKVVLISQSALARVMAVTAKGATTFTVGVLSTTGTAVSNTRAFWYAEV